MRTWAAGLVLAFSMAGAATADVPPATQSNVAAKATPEQIAAARKEGDALIFTANAQDVFDNETGRNGSATILLRHRASGFLCQFEPGQLANSVTVYPNANRGNDVGCNTMNSAGDRTTNFTRDNASDDDWIAGATSAIQRHVPGVQPAPPPTDIRPLATLFPGTPIPKSVRYVTEKTFEEDVIGHVDGWMVEDRFTAPRVLATSNVLESHWYATVVERMHHGATPDAAAAQPPAAQEHVAASGPSTPEEIAAARKEGDRILVGDNAQALFDNVTTSRTIALKHKASGLVCNFALGGANSVTLGRAAATTDRDDAVNCMSGEGDYRETLTLMPNTTGATIDQALTETVRATISIYGQLHAYSGDGLNMTGGDSMPKHKTIRLLSATGSAPTYIYISAALVAGWTIVEQVVGPPADSAKIDLMGELKMVTAVGDVARTGAR